MRVADIKGECAIETVHDLERCLMIRYGNGLNSFCLSSENADYPVLQISVKDDIAYLHYTPREFAAGYSSVGETSKRSSDATTVFSISELAADDIVISNDAVVPFSDALTAAKEFFVNTSIPTCIEWQDL